MKWLLVILLSGAIGISYFLFKIEKLSGQQEIVDTQEGYDLQGDGITDDTEVLQEAINNTAEGGTLILPPGVYKLSKNPEHKAVTGYGESFFSLKITKPITILMDEVIFKTETDQKHGVFWIHQTSNVHLKGGTLMGDKLPEEKSLVTNIAVLIHESQESSVENMYTKNYSQGIHLHRANNNVIRKVTSEYNTGSGIINFASDHNLIDSCVVRNSSDGHLSLYGVGKYNRVTNCMVTEDRPGFTAEQGITVESERYSTIENNSVSGFYYGIDIKNAAESNLILSNYTFNNEYNIAVRPGDGGENLMTPSHNIRIIHNLVLNPRGDSMNGIFVNIGTGHEIIGNTLNEGQLIITDEEMFEKYEDQNFFVEEVEVEQ
ncbi:right-handed parallel beta-helix repeat-containing protein [Planococcus salinarum]|uniref:right-handed parallel beta-helix repeat-containing protein n=1 Tax=Planococcus salinarum TaxID=622695 RepID=UPI000E3BEDB6|nr:glycosyl hydrolase family 28-related protein [Planococcus salinarum]TAA72292.1 right-handed parallel beta-helix repeat-containing protein [Planococcus salinarum]